MMMMMSLTVMVIMGTTCVCRLTFTCNRCPSIYHYRPAFNPTNVSASSIKDLKVLVETIFSAAGTVCEIPEVKTIMIIVIILFCYHHHDHRHHPFLPSSSSYFAIIIMIIAIILFCYHHHDHRHHHSLSLSWMHPLD